MSDFVEVLASDISIKRRSLVFGVGINDANYMTQQRLPGGKRKMCPYYRRWHSMLMRCYSKKHLSRSPSYKGCYVCDEWKRFSAFRTWMEAQEWEGMALDKDILNPGNKGYGPDKCLFVPIAVNNIINKPRLKRDGYPYGVGFHKRTGTIRAYCSVNGKHHHIGHYETVEDAESAYRSFKYSLMIASAEKHPRLSLPLRAYAEKILNGEL